MCIIERPLEDSDDDYADDIEEIFSKTQKLDDVKNWDEITDGPVSTGSQQTTSTAKTTPGPDTSVNAEGTTGKAQNIAQPGGTQTDVAPMQVDTPEGNDPNQECPVQGETGTRKKQTKEGKYFGTLQVSTSLEDMVKRVTRAHVLLYKQPELAENIIELVEIIYPSSKVENFKYERKESVATVTHYVVILQLGFNIGYRKLKERFGNALDKASYVYNINCLPEDINADAEETKTKCEHFLNLCVKNDIPSVDINAEIEREKLRETYNNTSEKMISKSKLKSWD